MSETIKKEYKTIGEAFEALSKAEQEHAIRVAEYMQQVFLQACSEGVYDTDQKVLHRLNPQYANVAYAMGKYHDIGKVLIPEVYHQISTDLAPAEVEVYKMHAQDSSKLAGDLLTKTSDFKNYEIAYIREGILAHHEKFDGSGFPKGTVGKDISILGRLLRICDALDHISITIRDEHPIDLALKQMEFEKEKSYDPVLLNMIIKSKGRLNKVLKAHAEQSKAIPIAKQLVKHGGNRPFLLFYRPITERKKGKTVAYEAVVKFKKKEEWQDFEDARYLLKKDKLEPSVGLYMVYEAADVINRFDCCKIPCEYIALELPYSFFNKKNAAKDVISALSDTEVKPERFCILYSPKSWAERSAKNVDENLKMLKKAGIRIMLSEIYTDQLSLKKCKELGITEYRIGEDFFNGKTLDVAMEELKKIKKSGMNVLTNSVYKKQIQQKLNKEDMPVECGPMSGTFEKEQTVVEKGVALQG